VGPGRVFGDLIAVEEVRTVSLSRLFRRKEESAITSVAHLINSGILPEIPEPDGVTKSDAYFLPRVSPEEAGLTIEKLVSETIPKKFGMSGSEIAVLTPSNRGELGAERLNQRLQQRLNPPGSKDSEQEVTVNGHTFRLGDRVCQRVNNYNLDDIGVFNGDTGEIYEIDKQSKTVTVDLWDGRLIKYGMSDLSQLSLAYALTVHRSQGSEMPCVVLALHDSHFTLLDRQLIYTAVTRAKRLLVVVGSKRALSMSVKRTSSRRRNSNLKERIQAQLR
jgi:exodeoxyribonuclease V alpha subunit